MRKGNFFREQMIKAIQFLTGNKKPNKVRTQGVTGIGKEKKRRFLGNYKTLKVIPRSKRTKENCNSCGVAI